MTERREARPRTLNRAATWTLIGVWLVCAGFAANESLGPETGYFCCLVVDYPESSETYPELLRVAPFADFTPPESRPKPGDRLLRWGSVDVRGLAPIAVLARAGREALATPSRFEVPIAFARDGHEIDSRLGFPRRGWSIRAFGGFALLVGAMGVVVGLRARPSRLSRAYFAWSVLWSISFLPLFGRSEFETWAAFGIRHLAEIPTWPLYLRLALITPEETAPRARWPYWAVWLAVVVGLSGAWPILAPRLLPLELVNLNWALWAASNVVFLALIVRNYFYASALGRRQLRWLLWAWGIALPCYIAAQLAVFLDASLMGAVGPIFLIGALVPLAYAAAIMRFNLFDIDRLISATAAYGVIVFALVGAGLSVLPRLANALADRLAIDGSVTQVGLAFALAAVVVPAQRALRPFVERVFYRERVALERGVEELLAELPSCQEPHELLTRAGERLDEFLHPDTCVIYGRAAGGFAPVFVRGRMVPPVFEAGSKLAATLAERSGPLARERWTARRGAAGLDPFDRAALETLGVDVVVPIRHHGRLAAFLCLGTKRSGDVYTSTDLGFLAAVASALSRELDRFDEAAVLRQKEAMHEALRRFVPGAIATRLEKGQDLASGERDLSILFVDIRGYTAYADGRRAKDVFGTINRYTEAVSDTVSRHGGSVVEFNGDGMMAVFGAPDRIPNKERAALDAGREIVARVRELSSGEAQPLEVGVGIATGPAFVGEIQAADRAIWSAIGSTTNLAARLQSMTRELDASVLIDAATHAAVGPAASDFAAHPGVSIRGRGEAEDVYSLPARAP